MMQMLRTLIQILRENLKNSAETLKIVEPRRVHGPRFSNSRDPWRGEKDDRGLVKPLV